jgi:hypothetical protein
VGKRVIQHAFDNRLANALFAGHHPENKASRNALLKLGFLGTAAKYYEPTGLMVAPSMTTTPLCCAMGRN